MRKRIAALFFCFCLTAAGAACEAKGIDPRAVPDDGPSDADYYTTIDPQTGERIEEGLHLFLDIPFGSTRDEVIRLAKENASLDLSEIKKGVLSCENQTIKVDGHDAVVLFYLKDDSLDSVKILFNFDGKQKFNDTYENGVRFFCDMETKLIKKYGAVNWGGFQVFDDAGYKIYQYPFIDGIDGDSVRVLKEAIERSTSITISFGIDNVGVSLSVTQINGKYTVDATIYYFGYESDDVGFDMDLPNYNDYLNSREVELTL